MIHALSSIALVASMAFGASGPQDDFDAGYDNGHAVGIYDGETSHYGGNFGADHFGHYYQSYAEPGLDYDSGYNQGYVDGYLDGGGSQEVMGNAGGGNVGSVVGGPTYTGGFSDYQGDFGGGGGGGAGYGGGGGGGENGGGGGGGGACDGVGEYPIGDTCMLF